jgi:hypothetical protein
MYYWSWSYKKKFVWNVIQIPLALLVMVWGAFFCTPIVATILAFILTLVVIASLRYTYTKWKREERNG